MKDKFLKGLKAYQISHAYLISGAGAKSVALNAAEILLCLEEGKPCGKCKGCIQFQAGSNMDFLKVLDEKAIKVGAVRAIEEFVNTLSRNGGKKIILIEDAERMNASAQNALLKILEEPPKEVVFLLFGNSAALLPTVISRCALIRLNGQEDRGDIEKAAVLLSKLTSGDRSLHQDYAALKIGAQELLECQMELLLEAIHIKEKGEGDALASDFTRLSIGCLISLIEIIMDAKKRMRANANLGLVIDRLLILTAKKIKE